MPPRRDPPAPAILYIAVLVLGVAAVIGDQPSRWTTGPILLRHAPWDGVLPGDLFTPVFLFFVGAAIPFSANLMRPTVLLGVALLLIATGVGINWASSDNVGTWRLPGVLQRAGVTLAAAVVANVAATGDARRRIALLASAAGFITLAYWLVMAHVPPGGGVPGDLSREGNLAAWVDRVVLGRRAWSARWDPDGLLSTLSSIATVLAGNVVGIVAMSRWSGARTVLQMTGAGAGVIVGGILATVAIPINRTLWSGSFVLLSGGVALILFVLLLWSQRR